MLFAMQLGQVGRRMPGANGPRYWRLYYYNAQNSTDFLHACDIELRASPGGANVAAGKSYTMSTGWAGTANEPWDGDPNSNLMSDFGTAASGHWCAVDLGLTGGLQIVQVLLTPSSTESNVWQYNPKAVDVQYSEDNATWTTSWSVADAGFWLTMAPQTLTKP